MAESIGNVKSGDAVMYVLEKMGQSGLVDATLQFKRRLEEFGFDMTPRLTVKPGELSLALTLKQGDEAQLPLFQIEPPDDDE